MPKRIWFTQQKPFGYMPLRAGLGLCTLEELRERGIFYGSQAKEAILKTHQQTGKSLTDIEYIPEMLCQKLYTTRTHPLSGEYIVVEGSRFKANPVEPTIEFQVTKVYPLDLKNQLIFGWETEKCGTVWGNTKILEKDGLSFPELDLGFRGADFTMLRDELLHLNKTATINTTFYVNKLEPIIARKV